MVLHTLNIILQPSTPLHIPSLCTKLYNFNFKVVTLNSNILKSFEDTNLQFALCTIQIGIHFFVGIIWKWNLILDSSEPLGSFFLSPRKFLAQSNDGIPFSSHLTKKYILVNKAFSPRYILALQIMRIWFVIRNLNFYSLLPEANWNFWPFLHSYSPSQFEKKGIQQSAERNASCDGKSSRAT